VFLLSGALVVMSGLLAYWLFRDLRSPQSSAATGASVTDPG